MSRNPIQASPSELRHVTFLSRHGVRSPTQGEIDYLTPFAQLPLPKWDVPPGRLSSHGQRNVRHLGDWYGQHYGPLLAPAGDPPASEWIHVHADKIQRDIHTAEIWLKGFLGTDDSGVAVHHLPLDDLQPYDPVFLGIDSGAVKIAGLGELVRGRIGEDVEAVILSFRSPIKAMQDALGSAICQPELYGSVNAVNDDGSISGTLFIAQILSDIFILEHANGWTFDRVAWGRIDADVLHEIAGVRTFVDRLLGRAPAYCRAQSSNMAAHLLAGLEQAVTGQSCPALDFGHETRIAAYFGHDTGVQSLGGLLNLEWQSQTFVANQTPPAGALLFELHRDTATGGHFVRLWYVVATLDQMFHSTPLSPEYPPSRTRVGLPRASGLGTSLDVPWAEFRASLSKAIDFDCVSKELASWLASPV